MCVLPVQSFDDAIHATYTRELSPARSGHWHYTHAISEGTGTPSLSPSRSGVPKMTCFKIRQVAVDRRNLATHLYFRWPSSYVIIQHGTRQSVLDARTLIRIRHDQSSPQFKHKCSLTCSINLSTDPSGTVRPLALATSTTSPIIARESIIACGDASRKRFVRS